MIPLRASGLTPEAAILSGQAQSRKLAAALAREAPFRLAVTTCLYDTGFTNLAAQVRDRAWQLAAALQPISNLSCRFTVVDNSAHGVRRAEIEQGIAAARAGLTDAPLLELEVLACAPRGATDNKGAALRLGFAAQRREEFHAYLYANLNAKVHLSQIPNLLLPFVTHRLAAVIGTRAPEEGGSAPGAGLLGRLKSVAYNAFARALLAPLRPYRDTNAPLKLLSPQALDHILRVSPVEDLSFDTEWLLALHEAGLRVGKVPIVWAQQAGSRPPWLSAPRMLASVIAQRRRLDRGLYRASRPSPLKAP